MSNAFAQSELLRVPILEFSPGQGDISLRRVGQRQERIAERVEAGTLDSYLQRKSVPFVLGPGGEKRALDRHHLKRTLMELGLRDVQLYAFQLADFSWVPSREEFLMILVLLRQIHMGIDYEVAGKTPEQVARDVDERIGNDYLGLRDNPYRGVIEELELTGDFLKPSGRSSLHYESIAADLLARELRSKNFREFDGTEAWYEEAIAEGQRLIHETDSLSPAAIDAVRSKSCQDAISLPFLKKN